jgi:hypothetical protein
MRAVKRLFHIESVINNRLIFRRIQIAESTFVVIVEFSFTAAWFLARLNLAPGGLFLTSLGTSRGAEVFSCSKPLQILILCQVCGASDSEHQER